MLYPIEFKGETIDFPSAAARAEFLDTLTEEEQARYVRARRIGTVHKLSLMFAAQRAPHGRVKGSAFPTRSWDRGRKPTKKAED